MAVGTDRILELVAKATQLIRDGKSIKTEVSSAVEEAGKVFDSAVAAAKTVDAGIAEFEKNEMTIESGLAKAKELGKAVSDIRDSLTKIYEGGSATIDKAKEMYDTAQEIKSELQKWKEIKKEIEKQIDDMKLQIMISLQSCLNMAKKASNDWNEMKKAISTVAGISLLASDAYDKIKKAIYEAVKPDVLTTLFSSSEHRAVDHFKENVHKDIEAKLDSILKAGKDYIDQCHAWQKIVEWETKIGELVVELEGLFTGNQETVETRESVLEAYVSKWMNKIETYAKGKLTEVFGEMDKVIDILGPGIKVAQALYKSYKIASEFTEALKNVPDSLDPFIAAHGTQKYEFYKDKKINLFDVGIKIPIASLGWISATFSAGIHSYVTLNLSIEGEMFNFMKDSENRIVRGNVTGSAILTVGGHIGIGVDLLGLVQGDIEARLNLNFGIDQATGDFLVEKNTNEDPKKGGIDLACAANASFVLSGELVLKVQVSTWIRLIVKAVATAAGRDVPNLQAETVLGVAELYRAEKAVSFNTVVTYDNSILPDFKAINETLRSIGNLPSEAVSLIKEKLEKYFGKKDGKELKDAAHGSPISDDDLANLKQQL
ncbi:MAG: hypothetical protein MK212_05615, partial [Saprospiraceae bacterium]|nr:hypothetical protein [Saprospiraceae bacterium]